MHKTELFTLLALLTPLTASAVPTQVTHEGYLADSVGNPIDGTRTITFGIYETQKFGSPFWTETHTVDVDNGHYTVVLGELEALNGDLFLGDTLYLEINTGGFRPGDRAPMVSVPYAFRSEETVSLSGGFVDASEIWVGGSPVIDGGGNWVGGTMVVDWTDLVGVPAGFADGDDAVLTEAEVDAYTDNNGYALSSGLSTVASSGDYNDLLSIPADEDTLGMLVCLDDQIPVASGSGWVCGVDEGALGRLICVEGQVAVFDGMGWVCGNNNDVTSSDIAVLIERIEELEAGSTSDIGDGILYGHYVIANSVDLAALAGYTEITGNLQIAVGDLPSLVGLESLTTVGGGLHLESNRSLVGLDNLTSVGGTLTINNNTLTSLDGLSSLTTVGGHVYIQYNDALTNIDGLSSLTTVGEEIQILENNALTNLDGLFSLTTVGGYVSIADNDALTSLDGLSSLTTVDGHVRIYGNDALTSLDGLSSLTSIGASLTIESNDALINFDGLSSLTSLGGNLEIRGNEALVNLDGLSGLTSLDGTVLIEWNITLCQSLVDAFVAMLESGGWVGTTLVSSNDNGC